MFEMLFSWLLVQIKIRNFELKWTLWYSTIENLFLRALKEVWYVLLWAMTAMVTYWYHWGWSMITLFIGIVKVLVAPFYHSFGLSIFCGCMFPFNLSFFKGFIHYIGSESRYYACQHSVWDVGMSCIYWIRLLLTDRASTTCTLRRHPPRWGYGRNRRIGWDVLQVDFQQGFRSILWVVDFRQSAIFDSQVLFSDEFCFDTHLTVASVFWPFLAKSEG